MAHEIAVGIVGAGIGGMMAAIAIAQCGAKVTVLEAASQLGEIGAGIQMTPNVARLLKRYEIDGVVGKNLTRFTDLYLRREDGTTVGYTKISRVEEATNYPCRVRKLVQDSTGPVSVTTEQGQSYTFDLLIGADGVQSIVRRTLFPEVKPRPATANCAYRAIVPYDEVRADPITRSLVEDSSGNLLRRMEVWMSPTGYIISYPISDAKDFNMVLSHFRDPPVSQVQEVSIAEVPNQYKGYDPRIQRIIEMIKPPISRWPLLVTGPLESWSNAEKRIVLMGDAAHSMTNHMAQGAATSMEDGVFLARCLQEVVDGRIAISAAVSIYERGRMPKASYKQQLSYLNGWIWHLPDGAGQQARDRAMKVELDGHVPMKSPNLYGDPVTVQECYGYDAEAHAEEDIATFLNRGIVVRDAATTVDVPHAQKTANWFLPDGHKFQIAPKL